MASSGPLRKQLGPARTHILKWIDELTVNPIEVDVDPQKSLHDNLIDANAPARKIQTYIDKFERTVKSIDELNARWNQIIEQLGDDAAAEVAEYDKWTSGPTSIIDAIYKGQEFLDILKAKRSEVEENKSDLLAQLGRAAPPAAVAAAAAALGAVAVPALPAPPPPTHVAAVNSLV